MSVEAVYVIVYNYPYDSGHYSPDWEERIETEDHGFFLTEEEAQAYVDHLNDFGAKYAKYLTDRQASNRKEQAAYDERMVKWNALADAGFQASQYMQEPRLALSEIKTLAEMIPVFEAAEYYSIQKVELNREQF